MSTKQFPRIDLTRAWLRRGPLACALWPLSLLFRALSGCARLLYRAGVLKARAPAGAGHRGRQYLHWRHRQDAADDLAGAGRCARPVCGRA
jgi:hypothetical protein